MAQAVSSHLVFAGIHHSNAQLMRAARQAFKFEHLAHGQFRDRCTVEQHAQPYLLGTGGIPASVTVTVLTLLRAVPSGTGLTIRSDAAR